MPAPVHPSRREALLGLGALALGCRRSPPPLVGVDLGADLAERGHRVRAPFAAMQHGPEGRVGVAILGAGVAGLSAAWRLRRAGYTGEVAILELDDRPGGTSRWGVGEAGPFALGAHYLTLPSPECRHVRAMLQELGVITSLESDGRPIYNPDMLCLAPEERLYVAGEWIEGLWPEPLASPEDTAQLADFQAQMARYKAAVGADGRPAFAIPVAACSWDPTYRALAAVSFATWLDQQGYTSPLLRWWLGYGTRDDYGLRLHQTSAWAGLHYHASRRPDPGDALDLDTTVLTWPAGNGWLVQQLAQRQPWTLHTGAVVRQIEPDTGHVWYEQGGAVRGLQAEVVIAALPSVVIDRLTGRAVSGPRPQTTPWRVAALQVDQPPASRGVPMAWDSVIYDGVGLGYVSSAHQLGRYGGPTVLSWYEPLDDQPPAQARGALYAETWAETADRALSALAPGHADLRARVQRVDVMRWGHGTVRPEVGLHATPDVLARLADPVGVVIPAHTDLSGLSLFEEASGHGVRAAEEALRRLGVPSDERLAPG